jgi:hypothetical protein
MPLTFYYCPYCDDTRYTEEEYLNGHIQAAHLKEYRNMNSSNTISTDEESNA